MSIKLKLLLNDLTTVIIDNDLCSSMLRVLIGGNKYKPYSDDARRHVARVANGYGYPNHSYTMFSIVSDVGPSYIDHVVLPIAGHVVFSEMTFRVFKTPSITTLDVTSKITMKTKGTSDEFIEHTYKDVVLSERNSKRIGSTCISTADYSLAEFFGIAEIVSRVTFVKPKSTNSSEI